MVLESQPISIANVENGVSPFVHRAWAWNNTGTDRFTLNYPNENTFWSGTQFQTLAGGVLPTRDETLAPNGFRFTGVQGDTGSFRVRNVVTSNGEWTVSFKVRGSQTASGTFRMDICDTGLKVVTIPADNSWVNVEFTVNVTNWTENGYNFVDFSSIAWRHFFVSDFKVEKSATKTMWTPSPKDDFNNAYPTYEGVYSDTSVNGSTDPLKYTWTRMRGEDGVAGKDGRGITNTETMYAIHTSGTTPPTTGWTASVPALVKGSYLWTRNVWTYSDNTNETGYSVTYIAKDGNNGTDGIAGKDGVGIKSTAFSYATSTNGTTAPTTGWTTTVPTVIAGNYLWTRVVWTYTDDTTETGYSVARWGTNGTNGTNGVSVTGIQVEYAQTDTATEPSTGWSTTKPNPTVGKWYWTRTRNTLSNGTYTTWVVTVSFIGRDAVIVSDTAPASPVKGTLWQTTTDPTVLEWNGSAWVIWGISIDNIVADNVIAENGRFQRIDGVEIYASIFGGDFTYIGGNIRPDIPANQVKREGTMTLTGGELENNYSITNNSDGVSIGYGKTVLSPTTLAFSENIGTGVNQGWYVNYTIDGIIGYDYRNTDVKFGLGINDMIRKRDYAIGAASGFAPYGDGQDPIAERHGRLVELSGAFRATSVISGASLPVTINQVLPIWARPRKLKRVVQQGSGMSKFLLVINPSGVMQLERYGTTSPVDIPSGGWINISAEYSGQDILETGFPL